MRNLLIPTIDICASTYDMRNRGEQKNDEPCRFQTVQVFGAPGA